MNADVASDPSDLYEALGLARSASSVEIRRAYRTLSTRLHPDKKGGDAALFRHIQQAYTVLSDPAKKSSYDATGQWTKTANEEFLEHFCKGSFRTPWAAPDAQLADQIVLQQKQQAGQPGAHTAGFQAWLRSRGTSAGDVFDADAAALQFGVVASSYQPVPLPQEDVLQVMCTRSGSPKDVLSVSCSTLPPALEWGQVLVDILLAPINPADLYTSRLGGVYGGDAVEVPFVAGHDGVAIVRKVGPGVKSLQEDDLVLPVVPFLGTWRNKAVLLEKDLIKVPKDLGLPLEYLATAKEVCLAYTLLERQGGILPGDCIILNAGNSTVGQALIQLSKLLNLRVVAVTRDVSARMVGFLKAIGATEVLRDEGSLKVELDKLKFFSKPKLAFDSVGAESGLRLADALAEDGELIMYGCMSGKAPVVPWQSYVFKELRVSGFNFRRWLRKDVQSSKGSKFLSTLASIGKLVTANLMSLNFTEYDIACEIQEAIDHAMDSGKNTKVILRASGAAASVTVTAD